MLDRQICPSIRGIAQRAIELTLVQMLTIVSYVTTNHSLLGKIKTVVRYLSPNLS